MRAILAWLAAEHHTTKQQDKSESQAFTCTEGLPTGQKGDALSCMSSDLCAMNQAKQPTHAAHHTQLITRNSPHTAHHTQLIAHNSSHTAHHTQLCFMSSDLCAMSQAQAVNHSTRN